MPGAVQGGRGLCRHSRKMFVVEMRVGYSGRVAHMPALIVTSGSRQSPFVVSCLFIAAQLQVSMMSWQSQLVSRTEVGSVSMVQCLPHRTKPQASRIAQDPSLQP